MGKKNLKAQRYTHSDARTINNTRQLGFSRATNLIFSFFDDISYGLRGKGRCEERENVLFVFYSLRNAFAEAATHIKGVEHKMNGKEINE